ncbi:MAG: ornithine cyclodeaminase family protein [Betaproteobacteria bacterium]|nr:ornithine cyclodeaminase family protein [Betaproteobacteria bacterium]
MPFLSAADIHRALDFRVLTDALAAAFRVGAEAPVRHVHTVNGAGDGKLLLMPAWRTDEAIGIKIVTVFPGNRRHGVPTVGALYVLLDGVTGHPVALLDGETITQRRTGAASALAARYLTRPDAKTLLVVGTGALAPYMARAHAANHAFQHILMWGRDAERARAVAAHLALDGLPAIAVQSLDDGMDRADVVTCATTSTEPIIRGEQLHPGMHIDLVGSFTPQMREVDDACVARAKVFVDTFAGALKEAGDLVQPIAAGSFSRAQVRAELADLVAGRHAGRESQDEITLFKSVGTALEDLAAARLAYARRVV